VSTALQPGGSLDAATVPIPVQADPRILVDATRSRHPRWRPGERLEHLFEQRCDRLRVEGAADRPCVDTSGVDTREAALTYADVDARANQLARYLLARGTGPGTRVALLFDDPVQAYVAMLAVLKAGAAYVPLDPGFPADRIAYIVSDAAAAAVLSLSHLRPSLAQARAQVVAVDEMAWRIGAESRTRVTEVQRGPVLDELAYIIYTSGSTGRPKGVAVEHPSIVNFVRVAAEVYGYRPDDRVYQGLTIAFDFSFEEIWVPWSVGATLVPKPSGGSLLGLDLHEFLTERRVTALCCVPTLLATVEEDLPALRFLLVSGEACPYDLVRRWHRPGRRFLNVYGPTEATVSTTWAVVHPDQPVTIGVPLPTYATVILDPDDPGRALPHGQVGEIGIAGIGLARGYVDRADLTAAAFVRDFLGVSGNVSGRIYRTGDLGRVTAGGEIEYLGRIDLQVKIRGYRVELTEIESVLLQVPGIAQAVVDTHEPVPGTTELVGYYSLRTGAPRPADDLLRAHLRERLPAYMVPAYLEHLPVIPMTTSDKADRKALPPPTGRRTADGEFVAPCGRTESVLAEELAAMLGVDQVSAAAHFFDDLGANSLLLARFAARVRARTTLPPIAMRDMYLHPTVTALAALADAGTVADVPAVPVAVIGHTIGGSPPGSPAALVHRTSIRTPTWRYLLCGAVQLVLFLWSVTAASVLMVAALEWLGGASTFVGLWQRSTVVSTATFGGYLVLSTAAKWLLVGRFTAEEFPLWGARYLRFWIVQRILRANPLAVFVGSPLYNLYLRCLGARVGAGAVVLTRPVPVCTDLLTIGAGTIVRKDTHLSGYRAVAGRIQTGPITIGAGAVVGEQSVLDIGTVLGDRAQLGHASSLQSGQVVPDGESWHGSPAIPCDVDHRLVEPARCGRLRRFLYGLWQLANVLVLSVPLGLTLILKILEHIPLLPRLMQPGTPTVGDLTVHLEVLGYVAVLFVGGILAGLVFVGTVPRLLQRGVREDAAYPLYGIRYWLCRVVARTTNVRFLCILFGDSSAILHYLRLVGYRFGRPLVQSGSNFGVEVRHENPYLSGVGSGTMVSDGLSFMNAEYSSTSFRVRRAELGGRNFLGNNIAYPPESRTGENCLLATKVMVPIDGPVRRDVGLLGSPPFEIPRTVERDRAFDNLNTGRRHRRLLRAKNRHNTATAAIFLLAQFVNLAVVAVIGTVAFDLYHEHGFWVVPPAAVAGLTFGIGFQILLERAVTSFRAMSPHFCSIYAPYFWWHERFWKMSVGAYLGMFNGTPMKCVVWRLLGVRMGRRVFDDGCAIPEKTLVHIGDDVALNVGSTVQAHSLEDGAFKSDHIVIGSGATVGPRAFVHYGVTLHEGAVLGADAFLMKGQEVPPYTRWRGNPAAETSGSTPRVGTFAVASRHVGRRESARSSARVGTLTGASPHVGQRDPLVVPSATAAPSVPVWATITTVALAVLIAMAMSAGVALALAPRSVPPILPVAVAQP
jgi:non-ribosomal peptide synthetase-like protein